MRDQDLESPQVQGTNALKKKVNPTRIPIENKESIRWIQSMRQSSDLIGQPERCVHVGDREADINELFAEAADLDSGFLIRTCSDRLVGDGDHKGDPPPGNIVMWRGLTRLTDIVLGMQLVAETVDN